MKNTLALFICILFAVFSNTVTAQKKPAKIKKIEIYAVHWNKHFELVEVDCKNIKKKAKIHIKVKGNDIVQNKLDSLLNSLKVVKDTNTVSYIRLYSIISYYGWTKKSLYFGQTWPYMVKIVRQIYYASDDLIVYFLKYIPPDIRSSFTPISIARKEFLENKK